MPTATTVAEMIKVVSPALATAAEVSEAALTDPDWLYEMKWDGIRAVAFVDDGQVTILNRRFRDITFRYPDVAAALATIPGSFVLDGELIAYGPDGKPSFSLAAQRDAVSKAASVAAKVAGIPVVLVAFDCLFLGDKDLRGETLYVRRTFLKGFDGKHPMLQVSPASEGDGTVLWQMALEMGLEGVIAKDARSSYRGRRTRNWLKYKTVQTVSVVCTRYDFGEGARKDTVGACHMSMWDGTGLVPVGRVGTGFNSTTLAQAKAWLDDEQPFIAEVACLSLGTGGQLRHPAFRGFRTDLTLDDCHIRQLDGLSRT